MVPANVEYVFVYIKKQGENTDDEEPHQCWDKPAD